MRLTPPDVTDHELELRRLELRLGLLNGLLVGLALALGVWAPDAIQLSSSHLQLVYPPLLLGLVSLLLLGGLSGSLTAWAGKPWAGILIWLAGAGLMILVLGHLPYEGRTVVQWLADRRSWGLPVYRFDEAAGQGMMIAGFFILLLLGFLGLVQSFRMEGIAGETTEDGRLGGRGWFLMLLPLPFVAAVGLVADGLINKPTRTAPLLVHEAIRTGRTYEGDLFALSLETGVNYNAIAAVRDQMSREYRLSIGSVDQDTVFVVALFNSGAWINCRVLADQLTFCYDASQPYIRGFSALLLSGQTPEDCPACSIRVDGDLRDWLLARSDSFAGSPRVSRLAQWGSYVVMSAESSAGDYALECRFRGMSPVALETCRVVRGEDAGMEFPTVAGPLLTAADQVRANPLR